MSAPSKIPVGWLVKLALVAGGVGAVGLLALRGIDIRGLMTQAGATIQAAGPWAFFAAMAVLPAFGFPLLAFYLPAGPLFAERLGMPLVVGLSMTAVAVNVALTYWLARRGLRPAVEWVLRRTPYRVPQVRPDNETAVAILVRVTPGPPFFLQGYILGLAGVRFRVYLAVAMVAQGVLGTGFIVLGKGIMTQGATGALVFGAVLVVAALAAVHIVRRQLAQRNADDATTR